MIQLFARSKRLPFIHMWDDNVYQCWKWEQTGTDKQWQLHKNAKFYELIEAAQGVVCSRCLFAHSLQCAHV